MIPGGQLVVVVFLAVPVFVGIPTVGMYRQTTGDRVERRERWVGTMAIASVVVPVVGPFLLWMLYSTVDPPRHAAAV